MLNWFTRDQQPAVDVTSTLPRALFRQIIVPFRQKNLLWGIATALRQLLRLVVTWRTFVLQWPTNRRNSAMRKSVLLLLRYRWIRMFLIRFRKRKWNIRRPAGGILLPCNSLRYRKNHIEQVIAINLSYYPSTRFSGSLTYDTKLKTRVVDPHWDQDPGSSFISQCGSGSWSDFKVKKVEFYIQNMVLNCCFFVDFGQFFPMLLDPVPYSQCGSGCRSMEKLCGFLRVNNSDKTTILDSFRTH